jgi:hypothetical protein
VFFYVLVLVGLILGLVTGALRLRFAQALWLASGLVLFAYVVVLAAAGGWAAQCWDCTYGENRRAFVFAVWAVWGAMTAGALLAAAWLGSLLVRRIVR